MESPIIRIETAKGVVSALNQQFDSHEFITVFVLSHPSIYLGLLKRFGDVEAAHRHIGIFLLENAEDLEIEKQGDVSSENIFGRLSDCALWKKV